VITVLEEDNDVSIFHAAETDRRLFRNVCKISTDNTLSHS